MRLPGILLALLAALLLASGPATARLVVPDPVLDGRIIPDRIGYTIEDVAGACIWTDEDPPQIHPTGCIPQPACSDENPLCVRVIFSP